MFAGLTFAMHDAFGVRGRQGVRALHPDFENLIQFQGLAANPLLQALALQFLHYDEWMAVVVLNVVDCTNVRVVQLGCRPGFALKAIQ